MTLTEFLERLNRSSHVVTSSREPDGSIFIECDHGFRDATWSTIGGPIADDDPLDDEVARTKEGVF